ncbi:uncharacterized protein [Mytilus edulis]|uniref:uncharacterized protein n=1 Tax=Mytilus edulis TaxID=6550 RepID=UPI0039EDF6ED
MGSFLKLWIIINVGFLHRVNGGRRCTPKNGEFCCSHFYENAEKKCIECDIGYTSENGTTCYKCPQPFYGFHCAYKCSCNDDQICDHILGGCSIDTKKGPTTDGGSDAEISHQTGVNQSGRSKIWPMILSSSVAALSFIIVIVTVAIKCKGQMIGTKSALKEMCKHDKDKPNERKTNIYGTYQLKRLRTEIDEYEFDSDNEDDEDPYAVIRDSQVLPQATDTETDVNFDQYNTCGYNHLHLMGLSRPPGVQKKTKGSYSSAVYGTQFSTFQNDQI